jgi:hypothetical protein
MFGGSAYQVQDYPEAWSGDSGHSGGACLMAMPAKLTRLETRLLHALQIYTRDTDVETIRMRYLKIEDERKRKKKKP